MRNCTLRRAGETVQHLEYVPFGETFIDERRSADSWTTPYLFSGKERDVETGLLYVHARYQDSKYGVWYSVDPLAEKFAGWSSYVYCHNNPTRIIDPTGKSGEDTSGKRSEINKTTGVPTAPKSSVTTVEPKEKLKPLPYTPPPPPIGEIKDTNIENINKMRNEAMNDPIKKQCLTDPLLQNVSGEILSVGILPTAKLVANVTTQIAKEKGLPILYKGAQFALKNQKTTETLVGFGIGVFSSVASGDSQDAPQIITGIPQIDNTSTKTQFFMTLSSFLEYIASGGSQNQVSDKKSQK